MERLSEDHAEVVSLLKQLQAQFENIGNVSSFVGYANVDYLRNELYRRGWNTWLAQDKKTVRLQSSEQALYWGVDEQGIPYPLHSIEEWRAFHEQHPDRIRIGWDRWETASPYGKEVEISTKFFGTDRSDERHIQRCMFETAAFLDGKLVM